MFRARKKPVATFQTMYWDYRSLLESVYSPLNEISFQDFFEEKPFKDMRRLYFKLNCLHDFYGDTMATRCEQNATKESFCHHCKEEEQKKVLFVDEFPDLHLEERYSPENEIPLDQLVYLGNSCMTIHLECHEHEKVFKYSQMLRTIKDGHECPGCNSTRFCLPEDSVSNTKFMSNWSTLNKNIDPTLFKTGSNEVVYWKCDAGVGHPDFKQSIKHHCRVGQDCPLCHKSHGQRHLDKSLKSLYIEFVNEYEVELENCKGKI